MEEISAKIEEAIEFLTAPPWRMVFLQNTIHKTQLMPNNDMQYKRATPMKLNSIPEDGLKKV